MIVTQVSNHVAFSLKTYTWFNFVVSLTYVWYTGDQNVESTVKLLGVNNHTNVLGPLPNTFFQLWLMIMVLRLYMYILWVVCT